MANYTITHVCGHDRDVSLSGRHADRNRRLAWLATQDCPACGYSARSRAAAAESERDGLPPLEGSPKQIKWAETIRLDRIVVWSRQAEQAVANLYGSWVATDLVARDLLAYGPVAASAAATWARWVPVVVERRLREVERETSARWWIDRRDLDVWDAVAKHAITARDDLVAAIRTMAMHHAEVADWTRRRGMSR